MEKRIEHVVLLMLENHSFDHLLGFLKHPAGERFEGVDPARHYNIDHRGERIYATMDGKPDGLDPDHSHQGALLQMGPCADVTQNGGFVRSYESRVDSLDEGALVMRCLDPEEHCPVLARLAKEFAVCTAWFCSVPGETWPNRHFAHAATSDGTVGIEAGFYYDRTIFEQLESAGVSWRVYYDGTPQVWAFRRLWKPRLIADFLLRRPPRIGQFFEMADFERHVAGGDLAGYTFIEPAHNTFNSPGDSPRRTNSQHPGNNPDGSPADFQGGEALIRDVYQALRANGRLFERTLLIITYDEHGGLYDHVSPPPAVPPGDPVWRGTSRRLGRLVRGLVERLKGVQPPEKEFDFCRLGFRVPAVLVSPWIEPGTLVTDELDHASIPATVRALLAPDLPPLTGRDAAAVNVASVITESPRTTPRPCPDLSTTGRTPRGAPEPAALGDSARTELDVSLTDLDRRVKAELRASPTARLLRGAERRRRRGHGPQDVFTTTAHAVRARRSR